MFEIVWNRNFNNIIDMEYKVDYPLTIKLRKVKKKEFSNLNFYLEIYYVVIFGWSFKVALALATTVTW